MKKLLSTLLIITTFLFFGGAYPRTSYAAFAWTVDSGGTLSTNLVAAYNLADLVDDKAAFDLTNTNSVGFATGKNGNAADAGASNTTKLLSVADALGIDGGNISISQWVNVTTAPGLNYASTFSFQANNTSKVFYQIYYEDGAGTKTIKFRRTRAGEANAIVSSAQTLTTGTWYHVVLTYDGTTLQGWLNGSSMGTAAASGTGTGTLADSFYLFESSPTGMGGQYFSGLIDATYVWSKKLSDTEVADLYNAGTGSFYALSADATPPDQSSDFIIFE